MITNDRHIKIFYFLCTKDGFSTSQEIGKFLNVSIRTVKNDLADINPYLQERGCHLVSKTRTGYCLEIDNMSKYIKARNDTIEHIKYSHTYKYGINDIISLLVKKYLFISNRFTLNQLADDLYISKETLSNYFSRLSSQIETFDIHLDSKESPGYILIKGREKDLRLFAKDYMVTYVDEMLKHNFDFSSLKWANYHIDFYSINTIVTEILENTPITFFEVGIYRISCYVYITCFRLNHPIDIKEHKILPYLSDADFELADQIITKIQTIYPDIIITGVERTALAMNIMAERDFIHKDVQKKQISDAFYQDTQEMVSDLTSYKYLKVFKLLPENSLNLWFLSINAKIISSTHKQYKPYVFFNEKSVSHSRFSYFLSLMLTSHLKATRGPTLNIYCISYITNCIYTHLMLQKPDTTKISVGVYSFLGRLTAYALIDTIIGSNLSHFIRQIESVEPHLQKTKTYDLLLLHQRSNNIEFVQKSQNVVCFNGTNFIDSDVIYAIKSTYIRTAHYSDYLEILEKLNVFLLTGVSKFDSVLSKYSLYHTISEDKQIVANSNGSTAFLFVKEKHGQIFDVYLLKNKFSHQGNRYKRLFVISADLENNDLAYYKTMEALTQVLSRDGLDINFNNRRDAINYIKNAVEHYLVETLL
ncbi:MAG: helix-turn-helix domain-containing protein [Erysipelotrichaceae bacterium]|nr:helix-turn-helix domain-containing protein [Erysipelotrichaceae bacterium]